MKVLEQVLAEGFRTSDMSTEHDFDPLLRRRDFQLLLLDLAFPADAFARER